MLAAYDELVARGGIEGRRGGSMHVTGLDATAATAGATRTASMSDGDGTSLLLFC